MQPSFFDAPIAPPSVTVSPAAIQARRSGRQRAQACITESMAAYRDALIQHGPCTDQQLVECSGLPLSSINARRNDLLAYRPGCIVAVDRVRQDWQHGRATWRTVWQWQGER